MGLTDLELLGFFFFGMTLTSFHSGGTSLDSQDCSKIIESSKIIFIFLSLQLLSFLKTAREKNRWIEKALP